jgi:hypothetical protein
MYAAYYGVLYYFFARLTTSKINEITGKVESGLCRAYPP